MVVTSWAGMMGGGRGGGGGRGWGVVVMSWAVSKGSGPGCDIMGSGVRVVFSSPPKW